MKKNWHFIYNRNKFSVEVSGLESVKGEFINNDETVKITIGDKLEIDRINFSYSPAFVYVSSALIIVASHYLIIISILKKIGISLEVDTDYVINYIGYQCPWTNGTLCKQIKIIRNGEKLIVSKDDDGVRTLKPLKTKELHLPDIEMYLYNELGNIDLHNSIFHISSGLDSSLLVLLASKILSPRDIKAASFSTLGSGASDELDIVKRLSKDIGFHLDLYDFNSLDIVSSGETLIQSCLGYPIAHPSHLLEYLLDKAVSTNYRTIVSGRGPDECLAGYAWHTKDYSNRESYLSRIRITSNSEIHQLFKKEFPIPNDQFSAHLDNAYGDTLSLHNRLEVDQRVISEAWGIVHAGVEFGLNVNIVKPFQNAELSKSLFNLDVSKMLNGSVQKLYLREKTASHYLDYLLDCPKRGFRLDLKPYIIKNTDLLVKIIESEFAKQYLEASYVIKMYSDTVNDVKNYGWQLWSLYLLVISSELIYK